MLRHYGGQISSDLDEAELIKSQIKRLADQADRERNENDFLSRKLDLPTFADLEIDHILPRAIKTKHKIENLQILCKSCHAGKTVNDRRKISKHREIVNERKVNTCGK